MCWELVPFMWYPLSGFPVLRTNIPKVMNFNYCHSVWMSEGERLFGFVYVLRTREWSTSSDVSILVRPCDNSAQFMYCGKYTENHYWQNLYLIHGWRVRNIYDILGHCWHSRKPPTLPILCHSWPDSRAAGQWNITALAHRRRPRGVQTLCRRYAILGSMKIGCGMFILHWCWTAHWKTLTKSNWQGADALAFHEFKNPKI